MRIRARIRRDELVRAPSAAWNAFVDLMSTTPEQELGETQRVAQLAYWYDAEVHKGGHARFFENRGRSLGPTLAALEHLKAGSQRAILQRAGEAWRARHDVRAGGEAGPEHPAELFEACDREYHGCEPELRAVLEQYLQANLKDFIAVED